MSYLFPALGAAVALAGGDKLAGNRAYEGMFDHLGWTRDDRHAAALAELAGGLLMISPSTKRIGGVLVAAASTAILNSEVNHDDAKLAHDRAERNVQSASIMRSNNEIEHFSACTVSLKML